MAIALFYISFVCLVVMFAMKYFGISFEHHEAISNMVDKNDEHVHNIVSKSRRAISKIRFKNFHKLTLKITDFIKKESIYLKRKFDSKQPAFFLNPQKPSHVTKNSVSFFIKNVTDYKNSLKQKDL
jgi:hypothetical protein